MRLSVKSAMKILLERSTDIADIRPPSSNSALVAGPPSPVNPAVPFPATVLILPVAAATSRMRLLPASDMKMSPAESKETPLGPFN